MEFAGMAADVNFSGTVDVMQEIVEKAEANRQLDLNRKILKNKCKGSIALQK